jgi:hypothetical protein
MVSTGAPRTELVQANSIFAICLESVEERTPLPHCQRLEMTGNRHFEGSEALRNSFEMLAAESTACKISPAITHSRLVSRQTVNDENINHG